MHNCKLMGLKSSVQCGKRGDLSSFIPFQHNGIIAEDMGWRGVIHGGGGCSVAVRTTRTL